MSNKLVFCVLFSSILLGMFAYSQFSFADISFSEEFGTMGDADDEFENPTDLAINDDQLYVVDSENNRIKMYELTGGDNCPSGTDEIVNDEVCFVDSFGSSGSGDGRFDMPTDLVIDKDSGDVYVVDSDNNRVQRFQADGDFDNLEFGSSNNNDDEYLGSPSAIAIHRSSDYIYVADSATDSISVFDDDGDFQFSFGDTGSDDDEFRNPSSMVIDESNDILYVADTENHRVQIFELTDGDNCPSGTDEIVNDEVCFVDSFGSSGSGDGRFDMPTDLVIDKDSGDVYVVDSDNNRVQRFQADGDFDNLEFGSSNNNDDEYLGSPSAIAIHRSSDYIYVADSATDSISVFDDDGDFQFSFGDTGSDDDEFRNPSSMVIDESNDMLYVADTENDRIQVFEIISGSTCPSGTDEIIDGVCFVEEFGSSGSGDGRFNAPSGLALDISNDMLYVADTDNHRIQIISYKKLRMQGMFYEQYSRSMLKCPN